MKERQLIETKNVKTVKNAVRDTITRNGFLAVIAEIGSGKTRICSELVDYWRQYPHKFAVVQMHGFRHKYSRISAIIQLMIEEIKPGIDTQAFMIEKKYQVLGEALRETKKKVILVVDEAQDFNHQTFRDLKKIHEITGNGLKHLFSIILFGKTDRRWKQIFSMPELGFRIKHVNLEDLTQDEIIAIAEKSYLLSFQNERVKESFARFLQFKTPLGIEYSANAIRHRYGLDDDKKAMVTQEIMQKLPFFTIKYQFKMLGIRQKDFAQYANDMGASKKINEQRTSEFFSGKLNNEKLESELQGYALSLINNRFNQKSLKKAQ
ncbi:MAG: ATP-binding protein [Spirochaetes bacterium]|nr:ATP-binding protein [Spirochaetota bacterium]